MDIVLDETSHSEALSLVSLDYSSTWKMRAHVPSVVANEGQRIDIPDGCVLENRKS